MKVSLAAWLAATAVWVGSIYAEQPVNIPNQDLRQAVEDKLEQVDPTAEDMLRLEGLWCEDHSDYMELTGLEYAVKLTELHLQQNGIWWIDALAGLDRLSVLDLNNNKVSDLSPLANLTGLTWLNLHQNLIQDIRPLSGLTSLQELYIYDNQVVDVSPLAGLTSLEELDLCRNRIVDVGPLTGLTALRQLNLTGNPLGLKAHQEDIPKIRLSNPGIDLQVDPPAAQPEELRLTVSSTLGGSLISPSQEGVSLHPYGSRVKLEVRAHPSFQFAGWQGTYSGVNNPAYISMHTDHRVQAVFVPSLEIQLRGSVFVADPGLGGPSQGGPVEDGTASRPFRSIQRAIEFAEEGSTIWVGPGTYAENIDLQGKGVHLTGIDPNGTAHFPVIRGEGVGPGVSFTQGEGPDCQFSGFVLMQGPTGGAIYCEGSSPIISNCLIVGNRSAGDRGSAVTCVDSRAMLVHCTIADNRGGPRGAGLRLVGSDVVLTHSILSGNLPHEIVVEDDSAARVVHSAVEGGWTGQGNIAEDPGFVARGRWESVADGGIAWVGGAQRGSWGTIIWSPREAGGIARPGSGCTMAGPARVWMGVIRTPLWGMSRSPTEAS